MGIRYDEEFKKQLVDEYTDGKSYPQLAKKYGIAKSTVVGWVRKYNSEECKYNSESQANKPYAKEIHDLNKRIAEFEKKNDFLKKRQHSSQRK